MKELEELYVLAETAEKVLLSVIGAVSPPGGDISEPVSQATLRIVKGVLGLGFNFGIQKTFPGYKLAYQLFSLYDNWINGLMQM